MPGAGKFHTYGSGIFERITYNVAKVDIKGGRCKLRACFSGLRLIAAKPVPTLTGSELAQNFTLI